jgi:hypothetical protein
MTSTRSAALAAAIGVAIAASSPRAAEPPSLAPGDIVVSFTDGSVQWRQADGALRATLAATVAGGAEGMRFDGAGHLYVSHWCVDGNCAIGNTIEKFDTHGASLGAVGGGYNCNPHALVFDTGGNAYVGQGDCTGHILKFSRGKPPIAFAVAHERRGSLWIDLAPDNCTIFYTSWGPDVLRFNACANTQLPRFNTRPLPGGEAQGLAILPDGGVLVSSGAVVARLNADGAVVMTYTVPKGTTFWAGLDLAGDGTFWAVNYYSSVVHRFDLTTGAIVTSIDTGAPLYTAVDVRVSRKSAPGAAPGSSLVPVPTVGAIRRR